MTTKGATVVTGAGARRADIAVSRGSRVAVQPARETVGTPPRPLRWAPPQGGRR